MVIPKGGGRGDLNDDHICIACYVSSLLEVKLPYEPVCPCRLVGRLVCHHFLKGEKFHFHAPIVAFVAHMYARLSFSITHELYSADSLSIHKGHISVVAEFVVQLVIRRMDQRAGKHLHYHANFDCHVITKYIFAFIIIKIAYEKMLRYNIQYTYINIRR